MIVLKWSWNVIGPAGEHRGGFCDTFIEALTALKLAHGVPEQGDEIPNLMYSICPMRVTVDDPVDENCPRCKGSGRIVTDCNGDPDNCPACRGTGCNDAVRASWSKK